MLCLGTALKLGPILRQPLSQTAPLQHGRKALHRRRPTLLRSLYRAISRHSYDQLGALKPVFGPERPLLLCRSQELGHSQRLHDLPPQWPAGDLADHDEILPLITAISWQTYETLAHNECWRERARLRWRVRQELATGIGPRCPWQKEKAAGYFEGYLGHTRKVFPPSAPTQFGSRPTRSPCQKRTTPQRGATTGDG